MRIMGVRAFLYIIRGVLDEDYMRCWATATLYADKHEYPKQPPSTRAMGVQTKLAIIRGALWRSQRGAVYRFVPGYAIATGNLGDPMRVMSTRFFTHIMRRFGDRRRYARRPSGYADT
jgi:hypothetical protein